MMSVSIEAPLPIAPTFPYPTENDLALNDSALSALESGEPIDTSALSSTNESPGLSARIYSNLTNLRNNRVVDTIAWLFKQFCSSVREHPYIAGGLFVIGTYPIARWCFPS